MKIFFRGSVLLKKGVRLKAQGFDPMNPAARATTIEIVVLGSVPLETETGIEFISETGEPFNVSLDSAANGAGNLLGEDGDVLLQEDGDVLLYSTDLGTSAIRGDLGTENNQDVVTNPFYFGE